MPLDNGTNIGDMNETIPDGTESRRLIDELDRDIKRMTKASFPGFVDAATGVVTATEDARSPTGPELADAAQRQADETINGNWTFTGTLQVDDDATFNGDATFAQATEKTYQCHYYVGAGLVGDVQTFLNQSYDDIQGSGLATVENPGSGTGWVLTALADIEVNIHWECLGGGTAATSRLYGAIGLDVAGNTTPGNNAPECISANTDDCDNLEVASVQCSASVRLASGQTLKVFKVGTNVDFSASVARVTATVRRSKP